MFIRWEMKLHNVNINIRKLKRKKYINCVEIISQFVDAMFFSKQIYNIFVLNPTCV